MGVRLLGVYSCRYVNKVGFKVYKVGLKGLGVRLLGVYSCRYVNKYVLCKE